MARSRPSQLRAAVDSSFEQLYRGHRADVFRAALRELGNVHDAEDVTQAAFVDAYRAVLHGSEPHAPRAWLLAIGENVRRRRFRTAQRRPREERIDEDLALAAEVPHELATALAEALAELPYEQRRVFMLRELAGLSYEEIAAETQSSIGSVQMLLFRARRSLRERLEPPQVSRRRPGILIPLPHWLAGLASRADVALVTPRAAGALGATVAAVVASVAVTGQAERPARAALDPPRATATATASAAPAAPRTVGPTRATRSPGAATRRSRSAAAQAAPKPRRVDRTTPAAARPASPVEAGAPAEPAATAVSATAVSAAPAQPVSTPERTRVVAEPPQVVEPADAVVEATDDAVEAATAPIVGVLPPPPAPPPLPTEPVEEVVTGAAGAAGVGVPPLPVPVVPPGALPPAP